MIVYIMNFCSASKFEYLEKQNTAVLAFFGKVTVVQFLFSYYARPCAQFSFFFGCIERWVIKCAFTGYLQVPLISWKQNPFVQVIGVHQTYHQFHHESVPRVFNPQLTLPAFLGRLIVGYPTILLVRFCSKALAKWMLPMLANALGIPVRSSSYVPSLSISASAKKSDEIKQAGYIQKLFFFSRQDSFEVDTGIRLFQYAGLAWSVVDLVPSLFFHLSLWCLIFHV